MVPRHITSLTFSHCLTLNSVQYVLFLTHEENTSKKTKEKAKNTPDKCYPVVECSKQELPRNYKFSTGILGAHPAGREIQGGAESAHRFMNFKYNIGAIHGFLLKENLTYKENNTITFLLNRFERITSVFT